MPITISPTTRRLFLKRTATSVAGILTVGAWAEAAEPPIETVALLSDTHIHADPERVRVGHNVLENLCAAREQIRALPQSPSAVFVNGDIAHQIGEPGDYTTFLEAVQPFLHTGLPLHLTLGNHDNRDVFRSKLPIETQSDSVDDRHAFLVEAKHANWFLLDSLDVTNRTPGNLGRDQIKWLDRELRKRTEKPAMVMAHHNFNFHFDVKDEAKEIVPCADGRLPAPGLVDGKELLEVFASHPHVAAFFCGHTHQWNVVDWKGIRFVNLPATAYPFRKADAIGWVACRMQPERTELEFHSLDPAHKHHRTKVEIRHRGA